MAKRLIAVTNIKHNSSFISANEILDHTLFTNEELKILYDAGAIRLEVDPEIIPEEANVAIAKVTESANEKTAKVENLPSKTKIVIGEKSDVKSTVKSEDANGKSIN